MRCFLALLFTLFLSTAAFAGEMPTGPTGDLPIGGAPPPGTPNPVSPPYDPMGDGMKEIQLKQKMIEESRAGFKGSCPCPYSADKEGQSCKNRSAWVGGGTAPLCFDSDITPKMLQDYAAKHPELPAPPSPAQEEADFKAWSEKNMQQGTIPPPPPATPQQKRSPFFVTIRPAQEGAVFGKDVTIMLRIENNSAKTLRLQQIEPAYFYRGSVLDAEGKQVPDTDNFAREKKATKEELGPRWEAVHGYSHSIDLKLTPHNTMEMPVKISDYYNLSKPGKYTIQLERPLPRELGKGKVRSNRLEITVQAQ